MYFCTVNGNSTGTVMMSTLSSSHWQQGPKLPPCGALNCFGKFEINAPINIVSMIIVINYYQHCQHLHRLIVRKKHTTIFNSMSMCHIQHH